MRVTKRVEQHIYEKVQEKLEMSKLDTLENHLSELITSVTNEINEKTNEYRKKLMEEAEKKYPELAKCPRPRSRWELYSNPDVSKQRAMRARANDLVNIAVENVIISLELGTPAAQLESLIDRACEDVKDAMNSVFECMKD